MFFYSCKSQEIINSKSLDEALINKQTITVLNILNNNTYESFPEDIFELKQLKQLSITGSECDTGILDCKNIQNVPSRIKDLVKLEVLNLTMNDIKYISDEINKLPCLKSLDLSNNLNLNIDNLESSSLEILNLNDCNLFKLPKNINKMNRLKVLGLEGNNIPNSEIQELKKRLPNCVIYF